MPSHFAKTKSDLVKIIKKAIDNKLNKIKIEWKKTKCMTVVLCSKGYPGKYKKNQVIKNIDKIKLSKKDFIYHAGTKMINGQILSNGGRVLNVSSIGNKYNLIRKKILSILKKLKWRQGFYRKDIGWKVINGNKNN